MNAQSLRPTPLIIWFGLLAGLASLAALQASLLPRWPRAQPLPSAAITAALRQAGLPAKPLPVAAEAERSRRSHEFATSAPLAYRLADGSELRLLRGTSRQRGNLQAALFARDQKDLKLEQRRLEPGPPLLARGKIAGRPALHTCWVASASPGGGYGVTQAQLTPLVDSQAQGRRAELLRVIGLQPNRNFSCVLISLRGAPSRPPDAGLVARLLEALPAALAPSQRGDGETGRIP